MTLSDPLPMFDAWHTFNQSASEAAQALKQLNTLLDQLLAEQGAVPGRENPRLPSSPRQRRRLKRAVLRECRKKCRVRRVIP
jgi:hypothetical protein